jgi:aminotransferase
VGYDPETEIIVTTGVQEGIYLACQALLNPGDEVLIGDPCYTSYADAVAFAEGRLVRVPTYEKDDFILQPDLVLEHLTPRAKLLVLVSPNNPTGAVLPEKTLEEFAQIAQERNLIVFSDEIYEKLVFDGTRHVSISSLPEMRERVVLLNGFSKSYAMTGWRVGYLAAPATFVSRCEVLKHALTISVSHVAQAAAIAALEGGDACVLKAVEVYAARRRMAMPKLSAMGLTYGYPGGTYYVFVNITSAGRTSYEFCKDILRDARVQLFPGTVYGKAEGFVRFSLSAPLPKLQDAFSRIGECVDRYRRERIC